MERGRFVNLGRMEYDACWQLQRALARRRAVGEIPDTLLFVEHEPVLTLGASFKTSNLLVPPERCQEQGVQVVWTDRGGDVTFHGPCQLVIYPIFSISKHGGDLHKWLRDLEETVLDVLTRFNLQGYRFPPHTGVWINGRKLAAIGIKVWRWISTHGIALNCNNDLSPFGMIVPCGIRDYGVTSLTIEVGREVTTAEAMRAAVPSFEGVFGMTLAQMEREELVEELSTAAADERA